MGVWCVEYILLFTVNSKTSIASKYPFEELENAYSLPAIVLLSRQPIGKIMYC